MYVHVHYLLWLQDIHHMKAQLSRSHSHTGVPGAYSDPRSAPGYYPMLSEGSMAAAQHQAALRANHSLHASTPTWISARKIYWLHCNITLLLLSKRNILFALHRHSYSMFANLEHVFYRSRTSDDLCLSPNANWFRPLQYASQTWLFNGLAQWQCNWASINAFSADI